MYRGHQTLNGFFCAAVALLLCCAGSVWAQPTAFTYQGKLTDAGNPANGNFDLQFKLFDTPTVATGAQQGGTLVRNPTAASAGVFTVTLDFGANVFGGADRYLEIGVRPAGSAGAYTVLAPRQPVTSSPYAIQTINAQQLGGLPASRYLTSDASGNFGIGTAAPVQSLQVNGVTSMGPPGSVYGYLVNGGSPGPYPTLGFNTYGSDYLTGTSGYGGVFQFQNGDGRLIYYTGTYTSAGERHDFGPRFTILQDGSVGIGTTNPGSARLHVDGTNGNGIYGSSVNATAVTGDSATNTGVYGNSGSGTAVYGTSGSYVGVWGKSTSFEGVRGETASPNAFAVGGYNSSGGGIGVHGNAGGIGVQGVSTGGSGVYGESAAVSLTAGGVYGKGTSNGSVGVIGVGVYARNLAGGRALYVEGNAGQDANSFGLAKAMLKVGNFGDIQHCYNSTTNVYAVPCGFAVLSVTFGIYRINFGFPVGNRFVAVSTQYKATVNSTNNGGCNYRNFDATQIEVFCFAAGDSADTGYRDFTIILF